MIEINEGLLQKRERRMICVYIIQMLGFTAVDFTLLLRECHNDG